MEIFLYKIVVVVNKVVRVQIFADLFIIISPEILIKKLQSDKFFFLKETKDKKLKHYENFLLFFYKNLLNFSVL